MAALSSLNTHSRDKLSFFSCERTPKGVKALKKAKGFSYIAQNLSSIEQEFNDMFESMGKPLANNQQFWLYCYYCSLMLKKYYKAYGKYEKYYLYLNYSKSILSYYQGQHTEKERLNFITRLKRDIARDLKDLASTPFHVSKIRDFISLANIYRIQLVFGKIITAEACVLAGKYDLFSSLESIFGVKFNVNQMLDSLNRLNGVLNVLSVGLFVARLLINTGMILKHTFVPSKQEKDLSSFERFKTEMKKRHVDLISDFAWGAVSGITNYKEFFGLSPLVSNIIMSGFLCFDLSMVCYRHHILKSTYEHKLQQYTEELTHIHDRAVWKRIFAQKNNLEKNWHIAKAKFAINLTAASLFVGGFTPFFIFTAAFVAPLSFMVCSFAMAMYISADSFGDYYKKRLEYQDAKKAHKSTALPYREMCKARNEFGAKLIKNTAMPLLIMAVFAINIPASIALTILFVGFEIGKGYFKEPQTSPMDRFARA